MIGIVVLIVIGILVFTFATILMKNVTDYGKNLSIELNDSDYLKGSTMKEKEEMIKNNTIAPNELAG